MSKRDYYEILSVSSDVSEVELKKAYRKLAMEHHPDRNSGRKEEAERKFKEINEAYEVLKDPEKRAAYDRFGHDAFSGGASSHNGFDFGFGGSGFSDMFNSIFEDFVGTNQANGHNRNPRRRPSLRVSGEDLRFDLEITLEQAFEGSKPEISYSTYVPCDDCSSTGLGEKGKIIDCYDCRGMGVVRRQQGFFIMEQPCGVCQGLGRVIEDACGSCSGHGRIRKKRTLNVNIPKGVADGMRIRLDGEGEAGIRGGNSGDLYIFLHVLPHEIFQREENNLKIKAKIPMTTAALGGDVDVPTIERTTVDLSLPEGTQHGECFKINGKGMPALKNGKRGFMMVEVCVDIPTTLTKEQRQILERFEELEFLRKGKINKPSDEGDGGVSEGLVDKKGKKSKKKPGIFGRSKKLWDAAMVVASMFLPSRKRNKELLV